jgi:hypothetical protein
MTSGFRNRGSQTLIPGSDTRSGAVYAFEEAELGRWRATAGARYDWRSLETEGDPRIGVAGQRRTFGAATGSAGLLYRVSEPVALVANVARGFRAPAAPDLFANGFRYGNPAGACDALDPGRKVHAVAIDIAVLRNDFAEVYANAHFDAAILGNIGIAALQVVLDRNCGFDCAYGASELCEHAITGELEDAAIVRSNHRFQDRRAAVVQGVKRADFIGPH